MADEEETSFAYKIVLIGDSGVGKTNIVRQFVAGTLPTTAHPTIGVEFATKVIKLRDNTKVKAQIWDTAGQERYKAITSAHYRNALGALLVYDITKYDTFDDAKRWADELKFHTGNEVKIVLIGNKLDIVKEDPSERKVRVEEAQEYARSNGMLFKETSAIQNENIEESFKSLLEEVHVKEKLHPSPKKEKKVISVGGYTRPQEEKCAC